MDPKRFAASSDPYPPLVLSENSREIRLLRLRSGRWDADLQATLKIVSLADGPDYEALSYTWGNTTLQKTITLNGSFRIRLTDNLFTALRRFRQRRKKRWLWIDALSIDQSNLDERSQQVALMTEIYRSARTVAIWVGDVEFGTVLSCLEDFPMIARQTIKMIKSELEDEPRKPAWTFYMYAMSLYLTTVFWMPMSTNIRPSRIEHALKNTEPPWVHRIWVRQEFLLARRRVLCVGSHRMVLRQSSVLNFVEMIPDSAPVLKSWIKEVEGWRDTQPKANKKQDLLSLRSRFGRAEASDPRDHIYGLLGLITDEEAATIGTDYTIPCGMVFAKATYAAIPFYYKQQRKPGSDRVLHAFQKHWKPGRRITSPMPSWAIDFAAESCRHWDNKTYLGSAQWPKAEKRMHFATRVDSQFNVWTVEATRFGTVQWHHQVHFAFEQVWDKLHQPYSENLDDHESLDGSDILGDFEGLRTEDNIYPWEDVQSAVQGFTEFMDIIYKVVEKGAWRDQRNAQPRSHLAGMLEEKEITIRLVKYLHGDTPASSLMRATWSSRQLGSVNLIQRYMTCASVPPGVICPLEAESETKYFAHSIFITQDGYLAFAPLGIAEGDLIVLAPAADYPMVLRPVGDMWKLQGFAYVFGIFEDELLERWKDKEILYEYFDIC